MLIDRVFGAELLTMFTVDYEPGGSAQQHDHPFEEAYFFLDGECEAELDGTVHTVRAGDVVFAGVGAVHGFYNNGTGPGALDRDPGAAAAGAPRLSLAAGLEAVRGGIDGRRRFGRRHRGHAGYRPGDRAALRQDRPRGGPDRAVAGERGRRGGDRDG